MMPDTSATFLPCFRYCCCSVLGSDLKNVFDRLSNLEELTDVLEVEDISLLLIVCSCLLVRYKNFGLVDNMSDVVQVVCIVVVMGSVCNQATLIEYIWGKKKSLLLKGNVSIRSVECILDGCLLKTSLRC